LPTEFGPVERTVVFPHRRQELTSRESDRARKALELARVAQQAVGAEPGSATAEEWLRIIEEFARIRPPEIDSRIGLVIMGTGGRDSYSVKPGNITMNMRDLVTIISQGVLTTAASLKVPWTAVFGAIILWNRLYSQAKIDLSEIEGSVLWTMWNRADSGNTVATDGLLKAVNEERLKYGRGSLMEGDLRDALAKLESIQTIERSTMFGSRWWLREWVEVEY
jgi:hypothetical protein